MDDDDPQYSVVKPLSYLIINQEGILNTAQMIQGM
jgi:hypothetical protein